MTDDLEELYAEAQAANELVATTRVAYEAATTARRAVFRRLRAAGQSMSAMAARLLLSTSRVHQILDDPKGPKK